MIRRALLVVLASCSASAPRPAAPMTMADWTRTCAARIEAARVASHVPRGETRVDASPWHPVVRFEARSGKTYFEAIVGHGQDACADYDSDAPEFKNLAWSDGSAKDRVALDRVRRVNGDQATLDADGVPRETLAPFRAAFEKALEACLVDAQTVPLGKVPADFSCVDKSDLCPKNPKPGDEDGCPSAP